MSIIRSRNALLRHFLVFMMLVSTTFVNAQHANQERLKSSKYKPIIVVVIGIVAIVAGLLIYAKMHLRDRRAAQQINRATFSANSGLNIQVVESLPSFKFSSLKGAKQGLQCAICLADFQEIEILRLLPKCKHGFHIGCIDQWLESHSTCPLCRQKVTEEDLYMITNSSPMRFIIDGQPDLGDGPSYFELFIEREDDEDGSSSRFSIGGSFRIVINPKEEEIVPLESKECNLPRISNHGIVVSNVVFKNRWSNVSSDDLIFLNSELVEFMSSDAGFDDYSREISSNSGDRRAMSDITGISRFKNLINKVLKVSNNENVMEVSNRREIWFDIVMRRVRWFANGENSRSLEQWERSCNDTIEIFEV